MMSCSSSAPSGRKLLIAACSLGLFAVTTQGHAGDAGDFGGTGGGEFRAPCNAGDRLVGIEVFATHVINGIRPVCGNAAGDKYAGHGAGSREGKQYRPSCPPGSFVTNLDVSIDSGSLVSRVFFGCWTPGTSGLSESFQIGSGEQSNMQRLLCPSNEVGSGIYGRAGSAIDRLGLSCEPLQVVDRGDGSGGAGEDGQRPVKKLRKADARRVNQNTDLYDAPNGNKIGGDDFFLHRDQTVSVWRPCPDPENDNFCEIVDPKGWAWHEHLD